MFYIKKITEKFFTTNAYYGFDIDVSLTPLQSQETSWTDGTITFSLDRGEHSVSDLTDDSRTTHSFYKQGLGKEDYYALTGGRNSENVYKITLQLTSNLNKRTYKALHKDKIEMILEKKSSSTSTPEYFAEGNLNKDNIYEAAGADKLLDKLLEEFRTAPFIRDWGSEPNLRLRL